MTLEKNVGCEGLELLFNTGIFGETLRYTVYELFGAYRRVA